VALDGNIGRKLVGFYENQKNWFYWFIKNQLIKFEILKNKIFDQNIIQTTCTTKFVEV
jgi:hypothetical protein